MSKTYHYTEDDYEQSILELFRDMGYVCDYGPNVDEATERDLHDACIPSVLELKSPSREVTNSEEAHQQLLNYMLLQPTRNSKPHWHDARNA